MISNETPYESLGWLVFEYFQNHHSDSQLERYFQLHYHLTYGNGDLTRKDFELLRIVIITKIRELSLTKQKTNIPHLNNFLQNQIEELTLIFNNIYYE